MSKSEFHNFVDFLDWDDFKLGNKKQIYVKGTIKLENSNSDADFETFKIIERFYFEQMKKKAIIFCSLWLICVDSLKSVHFKKTVAGILFLSIQIKKYHNFERTRFAQLSS